MGAPIDINLPPDQLKASISQALNNTTEYGVFQPNPRYPNRRVWTGEMEVQIGDSVSLKWDPKLREGYIDVEGAPGKNMKDLFSDFDKAREGLPKGRFLMSPGEAKDALGNVITRKALKHKLYARKFKNDSQVTLNEDLGLRNRPGGSIESFTLDTTKGGNVSIKLNDIQAETGAKIIPDSDGWYDISSKNKRLLQNQIWTRIKDNPLGYTKRGLNLKIKVDGLEKAFRPHGDKTNQASWTFDDVKKRIAHQDVRFGKIGDKTFTVKDFKDKLSSRWPKGEKLEFLIKRGKNWQPKLLNLEEYAIQAHKYYKSDLRKQHKGINEAGETLGHIRPAGSTWETLWTRTSEPGETIGDTLGNYSTKAQDIPLDAQTRTGTNLTKDQALDRLIFGETADGLIGDNPSPKVVESIKRGDSVADTLRIQNLELQQGRNIVQGNMMRRALAINDAIPRPVKNIARLTVAGKALNTVFGGLDAHAAYTGTRGAIDESKSIVERTADVFEAVSGASGLASLTPAAPVAMPLSIGTGLVSSALRTPVPEGFEVKPGSKGMNNLHSQYVNRK